MVQVMSINDSGKHLQKIQMLTLSISLAMLVASFQGREQKSTEALKEVSQILSSYREWSNLQWLKNHGDHLCEQEGTKGD